MPAQPAKNEPDRSRPPLDDPELELMARLAEELESFGPATRGQVARALERIVDAAKAPGLDADRRRAALSWARKRAEHAEAEARRRYDADREAVAEAEHDAAAAAAPPAADATLDPDPALDDEPPA